MVKKKKAGKFPEARLGRVETHTDEYTSESGKRESPDLRFAVPTTPGFGAVRRIEGTLASRNGEIRATGEAVFLHTQSGLLSRDVFTETNVTARNDGENDGGRKTGPSRG